MRAKPWTLRAVANGGSTLDVSCRALLDVCADAGLPTGEWLTDLGLDAASFGSVDARVSPELSMQLWQRALTATGDEHLALRVARRVPRGAYRVLEYTVASAETVGEAFRQVSAYFAWIDPSVRTPIVADVFRHGFGLEIDAPPELVPLVAIEFTFGVTWLKVRDASGRAIAPTRLQCACKRPSDDAPVAEFFGCEVEWGAPANLLWFSDADWRLPCVHADASLLVVLQEHTRRLVEQTLRGDSIDAAVRRVLYAAGGALDIDAVASKLGISVRTLQRRLAESGLAFVSVADAVRADLARKLVTDRTTTLAEVAFALGFADQSSFTRSFKRWTGSTPAAYRAASRPVATS